MAATVDKMQPSVGGISAVCVVGYSYHRDMEVPV